MNYNLPRGIVQACAGIVADCSTEPYISAIKAAEAVVGQDYADTPEAQLNRAYLVQMVKANLVNRKESDRESMNRRFGLRISERKLRDEKRKFCYEFAKSARLIKVVELSK